MATFEEVLRDLGPLMETELFPDAHDSCLLQFDEEPAIQLEPSKRGEDLIIGIRLGRLPPGKGREALFRAALMTNATIASEHFAYSRHTDTFLLMDRIPFEAIDIPSLFTQLLNMRKRAQEWLDAIQRGKIPAVFIPIER